MKHRSRAVYPSALGPQLKPVAAAVLAALTCGYALTSHAQTVPAIPAAPATAASTSNTLQEVKVTDTGTASEGNGLYTLRSVSIGKTEQSLKDTPQSISVITRQRLDDQNFTKVEDALKQTTGITVQRFDGAGNFNTVQSRGFDIGAFLLDGIPISQGANYATAFDTAIYDRVEVLRGPAGLLQGGGEPGGSINLVRKRAYAPFAFGANLSAGSFGFKRADVDLGSALNAAGTLRGRFVGVTDDRDSYVSTLFTHKSLGYGTLEYDFSPATTLSVGYTSQSIRSAVDQGLPTFASGQLASVPRSTLAGLRSNRENLETQDAFIELEHRLDNGGQIKFAARDVYRSLFYRAARANSALASNGNYTLQTVDVAQESRDRNYDLFITSPVKIGGATHRVMFGVSRNTGQTFSGANIFGANIAANLFNPNYELPYPNLVLPAQTTNTVKREDAVYGQAQISVTDRLKVLAGGRLSRATVDTIRLIDGVTTATAKPGQQFVPSVAAIYEVNPNISAYTSYAETFVVQTSLDSAGGILAPRTGSQVEAGIKGEFFNKRLNTHFALFRINDKNRAIADPVVPTASIPGGEVRSQGYEAEAAGQVAPGWDVIAGYAFTNTVYLKAPVAQVGQVFSPVTPRHSVNLSTRYAFRTPELRGWSVGGGMTYRSEFFSQSGLIKIVSGNYSLFNAQVAYQVSDKVSVSLTAENLFDKTYYEKVSSQARQNFYGEPRRVVFALKLRY